MSIFHPANVQPNRVGEPKGERSSLTRSFPSSRSLLTGESGRLGSVNTHAAIPPVRRVSRRPLRA
ncbi:MAG: hypothetical protein QOE82_2620 [Thermoanaerobaculia bacterium]|nr:hypothetical protein [Thermoanaerobaculia bacterium]